MPYCHFAVCVQWSVEFEYSSSATNEKNMRNIHHLFVKTIDLFSKWNACRYLEYRTANQRVHQEKLTSTSPKNIYNFIWIKNANISRNGKWVDDDWRSEFSPLMKCLFIGGTRGGRLKARSGKCNDDLLQGFSSCSICFFELDNSILREYGKETFLVSRKYRWHFWKLNLFEVPNSASCFQKPPRSWGHIFCTELRYFRRQSLFSKSASNMRLYCDAFLRHYSFDYSIQNAIFRLSRTNMQILEREARFAHSI